MSGSPKRASPGHPGVTFSMNRRDFLVGSMFNLNEDPYEQVNVAFNSQYRAERNQLIARLKQWVADTGDKFQLPSY